MLPTTQAERPPKRKAAELTLGGLGVPGLSTFQSDDDTRGGRLASSTDGHGRKKADALEREAKAEREREKRQAERPVEIQLGRAAAAQADLEKKNRAQRGPQSVKNLQLGAVRAILKDRYGAGSEHWTVPDDDAGRDDINILAEVLAAIPGKTHGAVVREIRTRAPFLTDSEADHIAEASAAFEVQKLVNTESIGNRINLSDEKRRALKTWTIRPAGYSKDDLKREAKEREAARKREKRAAERAARPPKEPPAHGGWKASGLPKSTFYDRQKNPPKPKGPKPWELEGVSRTTWYRRSKDVETGGTKIRTDRVRTNTESIYRADAASPENCPTPPAAQRGALQASPPQGGDPTFERDMHLVYATFADPAKAAAAVDIEGSLVIRRNAVDADVSVLSEELGRALYAYDKGPSAALPGAAALVEKIVEGIAAVHRHWIARAFQENPS